MKFGNQTLNYTPMSTANSTPMTPYAPIWQTSKGHHYNVVAPQLCGEEQVKVANLRRLLESTNDDLAEIERYQSKMDFLNSAELVTALVMETSIGFLDLAASAFSSINPKASKVAKGGLLAIESAGKLSEAAHGQRSFSSAMGHITDKSVDTAVSVADPKSIAGKAMLSSAKLHYDAAVISIKSVTGASTEDIKKDSFDLMKDRSKDIVGMTADGLKEAGNTGAASTLKGLVIVGEMYESAMRYQDALDKRFNNYLDQKMAADRWVMNAKMQLRTTVKSLQGQLSGAVTDLQNCRFGS